MNQITTSPSEGSNPGTIGWATILCLSLGAGNAVWLLGLRSWAPGWCGIPNTALTTVCFLAATAVARTGAPARYRWSIVAGLGFSALGDAFLMQARDHFVAGLGSFLVAHLCYLWALTSDSRLAQHRLPFAAYAILVVGLVFWLWPQIPRTLRLPVCLYAATITAMAAQAASRARSRRDGGAAVAALGAALFVVSDAALAARRFGHPWPGAHLLVLSTYFSAQAGFALSVVRHGKVCTHPPNSQSEKGFIGGDKSSETYRQGSLGQRLGAAKPRRCPNTPE